VVGKAISVYGVGLGSIVPANKLPECDVLELDCEGAELDILRSMTISPRVILVETHGLYGSSSQEVDRQLTSLGYKTSNLGVAEPRVSKFCEDNDIYVLSGLICAT
jgi:hypothetical protein